MIRALTSCLAVTAVTLTMSTAAFAQDDDDAVLKPAEPDFALVSLPTSLRLPKFKSAFRVTHRFTRPLDCSTCSNSLAGDGFGIDNGARIGLEYRFGIVPNGEIGVHRASDKTLELFGQYGLTRQGTTVPVETSALVAFDATNVGNRGTASEYAPSVGVIVTRLIGQQAAVHAEPIFVHHANVFHQPGDDSTFLIGLGARVRVLSTVYVVGEFTPRVSGYKPGKHHGAFGIEKRLGGHVFQVNFSNSFATTVNQIARGGNDEWYLGFNISRKFF